MFRFLLPNTVIMLLNPYADPL